ncbi:MAG TPA: hypothetical protein VIU38_09100 [Anaerolineales bacterium]
MLRNPNLLFLNQTFVACLALTFVSIGFATAWAIFLLEEPENRKRPGFNLKEL